MGGCCCLVNVVLSALKLVCIATYATMGAEYYPMAAEQDVTGWVGAVGLEALFCQLK
jgi:hypothetical protein